VIRTNLSTRPFYNERAVHTWLFIAATIVAVMTVFNVTRVLRYSRSDTQLAGEAARDETRAGQLRQQAALLRSSVDPRQIEYASTEARQANELIDRRTFSWTELFNKFETTLPDDVRITSVRPIIDKQRGIVIDIAVVARGFDDVKTFMDHLQETGSFRNLGPVEEHYDDSGLLVSALEATYVPDAGKPAGHQGAARR
jgi:Tfp pilus assembly protein PilN